MSCNFTVSQTSFHRYTIIIIIHTIFASTSKWDNQVAGVPYSLFSFYLHFSCILLCFLIRIFFLYIFISVLSLLVSTFFLLSFRRLCVSKFFHKQNRHGTIQRSGKRAKHYNLFRTHHMIHSEPFHREANNT